MYEVREVKSKSDIAAFHGVQDRIYKGDPAFIKPLVKDVEEVFNSQKNPAFRDGNATRILLLENGAVIGRAAAFYSLKPGKGKMGGIGFFECINDQAAANEIFNWCENWLKQNGCEYMDGPVNFGDRDSFWGLLVEAHTDVSYRENYNPLYYKELFETAGFEKIFEQSTAEMTDADFDFERFNKLAERVMSNPKYRFEYIDYGQQAKFASDFVEIYNKAWEFHEDFKPMTVEKIMDRFKEVRPAMAEGMAIFAYADNKPVGFFINLYELNQVFRKFNGKMNLWNGIRFLMNRNKITKTRGLIFGIVPEYHNHGLETGLIMRFREWVVSQKNIKAVELAWIGDFNPKMLSLLKALGSTTTKIHYTYRKYFS